MRITLASQVQTKRTTDALGYTNLRNSVALFPSRLLKLHDCQFRISTQLVTRCESRIALATPDRLAHVTQMCMLGIGLTPATLNNMWQQDIRHNGAAAAIPHAAHQCITMSADTIRGAIAA